MPKSRPEPINAKRRVTLAELVAMRASIPPVPADAARASLADRFLVPPFSVLDARQGYWQSRKRQWIELGIQSELGRGEVVRGLDDGSWQEENAYSSRANIHGRKVKQAGKNGLLGFSEQARRHYRANATPGGAPMPATSLKDGKTQRGDGRGRPLARTFGSGAPGDLAEGFRGKKKGTYNDRDWIKSHGLVGLAQDTHVTEALLNQDDEVSQKIVAVQPQSGTSIFDPVLCELAYRWFCPPGGRVLDPFAGGSVRGIVAAKLGRAYAGVDLRPEQAAANEAQRAAICPEADLVWAVGDSRGIRELLPGEYDFLFSCPPYYDLERYSDDPRDLSTMSYEGFLAVYRQIIADCCAMLKEDRFACFVVGDVRDRKTGNYRNFVGDTVDAFRAEGLELYNEAILVTAVGSLPIRVGKQFADYRKLGKTHQQVLVFLKGDARRACRAIGEVDVDDLSMPECIEGAIAICTKDIMGLPAEACCPIGEDDEYDCPIIALPQVEAALLVDVLRGQARAAGRPIPRAWVGTTDGWQRMDDGEETSYLIGQTPYLKQDLFPGAAAPPAKAPPVRRML